MLFCMSSLGGKISATVVGTALVAVLGFGAVQVVQAADARSTEPQVVQVADFGTEAYDPATVLDAQADKAARDEAARIEAERVAAEAAAAEAARVAAEAAAVQEAASTPEIVTYDEPSEPAPAPAPEPYTGPDPGAQPHTICEVLADGTPVPCQ